MSNPENKQRPRNPQLLRTAIPRRQRVDPTHYRLNRTVAAVYLIRYPTHLKVGRTENIRDRLNAHRREMGLHGGKLVAAIGSNMPLNDEEAILAHFGQYKLPGMKEELQLDVPVTEWARWVRAQHFAYVPDQLWYTEVNGKVRYVSKEIELTDLEAIPYDAWKPTDQRRIPMQTLECPADDFQPRIVTADDYYTPADTMQCARRAMGGHIDLDPASHAIANEIVGAAEYYDSSRDGLRQPWYGRVWLNPPFEKWRWFAQKACEELDRGEIQILITLISSPSINTKYLRPLLKRASWLIIPLGRITCWGPMASQSPAGHMLLVFAKGPEFDVSIQNAFPDGPYFVIRLRGRDTAR